MACAAAALRSVAPHNRDIDAVLEHSSSQHSMGERALNKLIVQTILIEAFCDFSRLCRMKPGDIVVDPLCGGGSIPIEAARNFGNSFVLCADVHELAVPRCHSNINHNSLEGRCDLLQWDSTNMPLRDSTVDVFVTDLPFGKRMGCKSDNRGLYRELLQSMARVAKPGSARAVLLTQDRRSLTLVGIDRATIQQCCPHCSEFIAKQYKINHRPSASGRMDLSNCQVTIQGNRKPLRISLGIVGILMISCILIKTRLILQLKMIENFRVCNEFLLNNNVSRRLCLTVRSGGKPGTRWRVTSED